MHEIILNYHHMILPYGRLRRVMFSIPRGCSLAEKSLSKPPKSPEKPTRSTTSYRSLICVHLPSSQNDRPRGCLTLAGELGKYSHLRLGPTSPTILQTAEQHRFVDRDSLTLDERLFKMTQRLNPANWFHVSRFQILFSFEKRFFNLRTTPTSSPNLRLLLFFAGLHVRQFQNCVQRMNGQPRPG